MTLAVRLFILPVVLACALVAADVFLPADSPISMWLAGTLMLVCVICAIAVAYFDRPES